MLVHATDLVQAMKITQAEFKQILLDNGFAEVKGITDVEFEGMTPNGQFVYKFSYPSTEDEGKATGRAYIEFRRKPLSSKFHYHVEF